MVVFNIYYFSFLYCFWYFLDSKLLHTLVILDLSNDLSCSQKATFLHGVTIVRQLQFFHVLKPLPNVFKSLMIIGIIATFLHCGSLPISVLSSWYRSIFSCSFCFVVVPNGHATSIIWHFFVSLSTVLMSGLLCFSLG